MQKRDKSTQITPSIKLTGTTIGIIQAGWHAEQTDNIVTVCKELLEQFGCWVEVHHVPGCYELPFAAKKLASLKKYSALVVVGAVVQGETEHYRMIIDHCVGGLGKVQYDFDLPIIMEVLGVRHVDHITARSTGEHNKGIEAARTVLEIVSWARSLDPHNT